MDRDKIEELQRKIAHAAARVHEDRRAAIAALKAVLDAKVAYWRAWDELARVNGKSTPRREISILERRCVGHRCGGIVDRALDVTPLRRLLG